MRAIVHAVAGSVRRAPRVVIVATLVVSAVLGFFASRFQPAANDNASFAPRAPEIQASSRIQELFGADATERVFQVVVSADRGDVITLDGLAAAEAVEQALRSGALADRLVGGKTTPPVVHFLTPVTAAIARGAPVPTSDADVKRLYAMALQRMPAEQRALVTHLLPTSADTASPASPRGLVLAFTTGPRTPEDFDAFAATSAQAAAELEATALPDGIEVRPFSFELLVADDTFQQEIGRLFGTAALIILLVLTVIFLVRPRRRSDRVLSILGFAGMVIVLVLALLPGIGRLAPGVVPAGLADLPGRLLLGLAALVFVVVYLTWSVGSKGLRRTSADTGLAAVTIVLAIIWMYGYGFLRFGEQGPMVQLLPILLIGLGVDYAIHVNARYREEVSAGRSVDESVAIAIRTVGVALILATVTTAVGFLTNLTNDIPALREFGELAAVGILASFLLMLTFVPAVRELLDRHGERRATLDRPALVAGSARRLPRFIGRAAWLPRHAAVATIVVSLLLGGLGVWGTTNLEAKFSFVDFIPTTSPLRTTFQVLADEFGGGFGESTQVLITGPLDTPEAYNALVEATVDLAGVPDVATIDGLPQADSPVSLVFRYADPTSPTFDPAVGRAAAAAGLGPGRLEVGPDADVAALYAAVEEAAPEAAARVLHRGGAGGHDAARFDIVTRAGEQGARRLREDLARAFAPVATADLEAVATSQAIISDVVVTTLQRSQLSSLLLTLLAALVLLVANFWYETRRPLLGVITTLPVVLVVFWSFGIMALAGVPFGPTTATISALAIGIGIPYMIHVTHRYLEDRARTRSAEEAVELTLLHTGGALAGSALTTVAGFGVLVISSTIPFRQFGFVTGYTILFALAGAVAVLPSYLVVWDRWHRRRGEDPVDVATLERLLEEDLRGGGGSS